MKQTSLWEMDEQPQDGSLIKVNIQEACSKDGKNFQKKVLKIEKLQKANEALKVTFEDIRQRLAKIMTPISDRFCDLRLQSLEILDGHMQGTYFRTNEKKKITTLILEGAEELIGGFQDERGKPFYDKYSTISFDEQEASMMEGMESMFHNLLGNREEDLEEPLKPPITKGPRKAKTKAELHEEKIQVESKAIYRDLMKQLHPDFEPDEAKKREKN